MIDQIMNELKILFDTLMNLISSIIKILTRDSLTLLLSVVIPAIVVFTIITILNDLD